jgi:hypothetical protein
MEPITVEYLGSQIAETTYLNPKGTLTLCILTMKNGLNVVGESACLDPARFDAEVGKRIAYQNAFGRLWQPYGFIRAEQARWDKVTVNSAGVAEALSADVPKVRFIDPAPASAEVVDLGIGLSVRIDKQAR